MVQRCVLYIYTYVNVYMCIYTYIYIEIHMDQTWMALELAGQY